MFGKQSFLVALLKVLSKSYTKFADSSNSKKGRLFK